MAKIEQAGDSTGTIPSNPYKPANWEEHQADQKTRKEARAAKNAIRRKCLDPEVAAQIEARKPLYEFQVSATYDKMNPDNGRPEEVDKTGKFIAQDEATAWAMFCDKFQTSVGPAACAKRTVKKLGRVGS